MISITLFNESFYLVRDNSRIAFGLDKVYFQSINSEGIEVMVTVDKNDIQFIQILS